MSSASSVMFLISASKPSSRSISAAAAEVLPPENKPPVVQPDLLDWLDQLGGTLLVLFGGGVLEEAVEEERLSMPSMVA